MKRSVLLVLCVLLLLSLAPGAAAAEYPGALRTSRYCPEAPMKDHRALFSAIEGGGLNTSLTRSMASYILAGLMEADTDGYTADAVTDVAGSHPYAQAVYWAVNKGLFLLDGGVFLPDQPISREDLALAVSQSLLTAGRELPRINERYSFFDMGLMNNVKQEAAVCVQRGGVMLENGDGYFCPYEGVTIAEAEHIFLRLAGGMRLKFPDAPVSTVKESAPVDDSWFDDACFIGHSQVVGMSDYFNLPNADFYAVIGHKAAEVLQFPWYTMPSGRMGTLKNSLSMATYGKVFIMLGVNDFEKKDQEEKFMVPMRQLLDLVKTYQPQARIYLISVAPVGRETKNNLLYNPENVIFYSQMIKDLSREYGTEYLDIFRYLSDEDGYLRDDVGAGDGIHFKAKSYAIIKDFFKCHTGS